MFKLSPEQVEYINKEIDINNRICDSKPSAGVYNLIARREALRLMVQLHNVTEK